MALDAIIFDLDGTLIDANGLHTRAWVDAFAAFGYRYAADRIAVEIGKGGSMLVPDVAGQAVEQAHGQALRDRHDARYLELLEAEGLQLFPRVHALADAVHARGLQVAVATASKQKSLQKVVEVSGFDVFAWADVVVTDTDVEQSKPHPDVVAAACRKLGLSPAQCVMVGDTPYDVEAARRAGVACLGVLTGVHPADAMRRAGARAVYDDVADLLDHLDEAVRVASPGSAHLTAERLEALMEAALEEARAALAEGEPPAGCVLARGNGEVVARGHSRTRSGGPLAHAELEVLRAAAGEPDLILVGTVEPSVLGYGAALEAQVDTLVYGCAAPGGVERCTPRPHPERAMPRVIGGVRAEACRLLLDADAHAGRDAQRSRRPVGEGA